MDFWRWKCSAVWVFLLCTCGVCNQRGGVYKGGQGHEICLTLSAYPLSPCRNTHQSISYCLSSLSDPTLHNDHPHSTFKNDYTFIILMCFCFVDASALPLPFVCLLIFFLHISGRNLLSKVNKYSCYCSFVRTYKDRKCFHSTQKTAKPCRRRSACLLCWHVDETLQQWDLGWYSQGSVG